jgi:hypothetical protein
MCRIRGARMGMIFQEPMSPLNPVMTVGGQIGESLRADRGLRGRDASAEVVELLGSVGIPDPQRRAQAYPHQFSGGMKQRAMIAMLLITHDLGVVAETAQRLAVMYAGELVEEGDCEGSFRAPGAPARGARPQGPFPDPPGDPAVHRGLGLCGGRGIPVPRPGTDNGPGGGVRVRQDHGGHGDRATQPAHRGLGAIRRAGVDPPRGRGPAQTTP